MEKRKVSELSNTSLRQPQSEGFSTLQLIITMALVTIISAFGVMTITRARAGIRLTNSSRILASYLEKARSDAVRRHGFSTVEVLNTAFPQTTYRVTMDFDHDGITESRDFSLEQGIRFTTPPGSLMFDWRGRITQEVSIGMAISNDESRTTNIGVTASGDVTLDSVVFQDSDVPAVVLNNGSVNGDVVPDPYPTPQSSPYPTSTPTPTPKPTPDASQSPTPTPDPHASPTPYPSPDVSPTPGASPTPAPSVSPSPSPTPITGPCTITLEPNPLQVIKNGSGSVAVNIGNYSGSSVTVTATPGNSGAIQVLPSSKTVSVTNGTARAIFVITVKSQSNTALFNSPCGSKTLTITVR